MNDVLIYPGAGADVTPVKLATCSDSDEAALRLFQKTLDATDIRYVLGSVTAFVMIDVDSSQLSTFEVALRKSLPFDFEFEIEKSYLRWKFTDGFKRSIEIRYYCENVFNPSETLRKELAAADILWMRGFCVEGSRRNAFAFGKLFSNITAVVKETIWCQCFSTRNDINCFTCGKNPGALIGTFKCADCKTPDDACACESERVWLNIIDSKNCTTILKL